jgi:phasin
MPGDRCDQHCVASQAVWRSERMSPIVVERPARKRSPKVSGEYLKYSRFAETAAGDRIRSTLRGRARSVARQILPATTDFKSVITSPTNPEDTIMMDPKMTMEVPENVRQFAEQSVDQAEKAVSSFMDAASRSVAVVPGPMTDLAKQALAITEKNLKASFEHARKLMHAKDISEVMQLQSEFLRNQFGAATEQFNQMTGGAASGANDDKEKPELI